MHRFSILTVLLPGIAFAQAVPLENSLKDNNQETWTRVEPRVMMADRDFGTRFAMPAGLMDLKKPRANDVPKVSTAASEAHWTMGDLNPDLTSHTAAGSLLSTDHSKQVLRTFQSQLLDPDWTVRASAVHAIALRNVTAPDSNPVPLFDDNKEAPGVRAAARFFRLETVLRPDGSVSGVSYHLRDVRVTMRLGGGAGR